MRRRETGEFGKADYFGSIECAELASNWVGKITHNGD
jgi:hypothetical protein